VLVNRGSEGKFYGLRMGRLRARTNRSGVVRVGALAREAAHFPEVQPSFLRVPVTAIKGLT